MRKQFLCGVSALAIVIGSSNLAAAESQFAADWSGYYFGAHTGYGITGMSSVIDSGGSDEVRQNSNNGLLVGFHAGYNWQSGDLVFGIEGDIAKAHWNKTSEGSLYAIESTVEALASVRARIGFDVGRFAGRPVHLYATGGLAFVDAGFLLQSTDDETSGSLNSFGAVAGAGFETRITDNITLGLEGLYYIFDKETPAALADPTSDPGSGTLPADIEGVGGLDNIFAIRVRLSFNF